MSGQKDNKNNIASDLNDMAELLEANNLIGDAQPIYETVGKVSSSIDAENWNYECNNLKFSSDGAIAGTIPQGVSYIEITFSINVGGPYYCNPNYSNPLHIMQADLEILGMNENSSDLYSAWHFDKHIREENDNESKYSHPEYHLTFGGNKMESMHNAIGDCLILPAPRLLYPPLDLVLGIDFIIQNYFTLSKRQKLMEEPRYKEIVHNSQCRLWKPFFTSLSTKWNSLEGVVLNENIHFNRLFPFLTR